MKHFADADRDIHARILRDQSACFRHGDHRAVLVRALGVFRGVLGEVLVVLGEFFLGGEANRTFVRSSSELDVAADRADEQAHGIPPFQGFQNISEPPVTGRVPKTTP